MLIRAGWPPVDCQSMPVGRQTRPVEPTSRLWPTGGAHLWPSGGTSLVHSHRRGHLVYAARGVLSVHTERDTSIVPANRVAWIPAGFAHYHRAHGDTDMRIEFLPASLARLVPGHPAVFTALRPRPRNPAHAHRPTQRRPRHRQPRPRPERAPSSRPGRRTPRGARAAAAIAATMRRPAASHRATAV
jgi:hypothetical protein